MLAAITRQWSLSLPDDLHYDPLVAAPVELAVEDLLPRSEVQLPARDRYHHLPPHDLSLVMRVAVVFAGAVVVVPLRAGIVGCQPLQPALVVFVQAAFIVVDEDAGG